jgi:glycosyltransferase involved in cell wall biosynthesis
MIFSLYPVFLMRILITEEALQDGFGHWPSYVGDIATGLRSLGDEVHVAVHRNATQNIIARVGGTPWFSRNCWIDPKSQGAMGGLVHNLIFFRELLSWLRNHQSYDWICAFTIRLQHLLAFALLARSGTIPRKTRFFLLFVQGFGRYAGHGKPTEFPKNLSTMLARFCFWLLTPAARSGRVVVAAETKGMKDELERFTGLPVTLAPHPVHFTDSSKTTLSTTFRSQVSGFIPLPLTITCPGFARHEKGTDLLQDAIRILLSRPDANRFRFVLQWPEPFAMLDDTIIGPNPALLKDSRVEFLNQNLNSEEYDALLNRTNLIILPYRRSSYHHRVSRVAIEAAGRGLPMIYSKGTWSEEVADLVGSGVVIADESAENVVKSILKASDEFSDLAILTGSGACRVREYHSVESLRSILKS